MHSITFNQLIFDHLFLMDTTDCNDGFLSSPQFLSISLHSLSTITTPIHFFGLYCILWKTPESMKSVKAYLVNLHVWIMVFDYTLGLLTIPYFLFPHLAGFPVGILQYLGVPNMYQCSMLLLFLLYVANSILAVFENRFHVVCVYPGKEHWKYWRRWWLVAHYIGAFILIASLLDLTPDQETARKHVFEAIPCLRHHISETQLFVYSENILFTATVYGFYAGLTILESFLFVGVLAYFTLRQLKSKKMSRRTFNIQKKFLMALIIQMEVPMIMLLFPCLYAWLSIVIGYHNQVFINIAVVIGSMHGLCSTSAMILVHNPYRGMLYSLLLKSMRLFTRN